MIWCLCQVAEAVVAAYERGELQSALESADAYKAWVKGLGKAQKRKGKRLFMPLRIALTGNSHVSPPSIPVDVFLNRHIMCTIDARHRRMACAFEPSSFT